MLQWIAQNSVAALAVALAAWAVAKTMKHRPAAAHALWVLVLVALVAPPLPVAPWRGVRDHARDVALAVLPAPVIAAPAQTHVADKDAPSPFMAGDVVTLAPAIEAVTVERGPRETKFGLAGVPTTLEPRSIPVGGSYDVTDGWSLPDPLLAAGVIWLLGSAVALFRLVARVRRLSQVARYADDAQPWLAERVREVAKRLGVAPPRVKIVEGLPSPMVWAIVRPTLVWPAHCNGASSEDRCVIAHELAHLKRRDHWVAWLEALVTVALWWHPLVYIARRQVRAHAELSCDAWVVWAEPGQARVYARALIDAAERFGRAMTGSVALGVADSRARSFQRRLRMILLGTNSRRMHPVAALLGAALCAVMLPTWAGGSVDPEIVASARQPQLAPIDAEIRPYVRALELERRLKVFTGNGEIDLAREAFAELESLPGDHGDLNFSMAHMLHKAGMYAEAQKLFAADEAAGRNPGSSAYNQACAAAMSGRKDEALANLERSLRLGFAVADHAENDSDLEFLSGDAEFTRIIEASRAASEAREAAEEALEKKQFAEAAGAWTRLVALAPLDGEAYDQLGRALFHAGQHAQADAAWRRQVELNHEPATGLHNRACALAAMGRVDEAVASLEEAYARGATNHEWLREDPDLKPLASNQRFKDLVARITRPARLLREADVAMEFEDWPAATERIGRALELDGLSIADRQSAQERLAAVQMKSGDYRNAVQGFIAQAREGRNLQFALYNAACCYSLMNQADAGVAYLSAAVDSGWADEQHMMTDSDLEAVRRHPAFLDVVTRAQDRWALELFGAADWAHVEARASRDLEVNPDNGRACLQLGWAFLRTGRVEEAITMFQRQAEADHLPGIANYNVACCYARLGRKDDAIAFLERAVAIGFGRADSLKTDPDLVSLHEDPRFQVILERLQASEKVSPEADASSAGPAIAQTWPKTESSGGAVKSSASSGPKRTIY